MLLKTVCFCRTESGYERPHHDGKCGEGKCGAKADEEGKCGEEGGAKSEKEVRRWRCQRKRGKCGEGKCGVKSEKEGSKAKVSAAGKKELSADMNRQDHGRRIRSAPRVYLRIAVSHRKRR